MTALDWVRSQFHLLWETLEGFEVIDPQTGANRFIPREEAKQAGAA